MRKKIIKNSLLLIIILYIFYINEKIQIIVHQKKLISNEIKISVIIPIYNGGKYLNISLRSVQNQKMKDIEIIIVDDNSGDDSLEIIHNYMKNDKRIKLIENNETRRILFCKSMGVLNAKGKYIIEIDQDDMFIRDDAFDILFEESEKYDLDLLNFNYIYTNNSLDLQKVINHIKNINIIQKIPKPKFFILKENLCLLWGNIINADLYKKVIYNLWPIIINYKIIFQEDFLITFFILIYAQKSKHLNNIFYYYFVNLNQASRGHQNNPQFLTSVIFAGIIFYNYYIKSNPQDFQIIINYIDLNKHHFKKIQILYPSLFKYLFGKILTNNQLPDSNKNFIMNEFNISENCDSYPSLKKKQNFFIINKFSENIACLHTPKIELIELSIIIICSFYDKIIKIIKVISSQDFDNLEIIIIYDDENKNDYNLINNYIKSFDYIKLIDNKIKRGTLYSISKGVSIAKGNYLFILDPNCFFSSKNAFKILYKKAKKYDADIIEFNLFKILQNNYINLYQCKHFESRFNLTLIKYNQEFNNIDIENELLTNKIFKSECFKNIIKEFRLDEFTEIIDQYYNKIFEFIIENSKYTFKRISSPKIYINDFDCDKPKFNNFTTDENKRINELIFYINFIYDNSGKNFENKEMVLKEFFNVLSVIFNKFTKISKYSIKLLKKFIRSEYISKSNKILLKFYYNSLIN